MISVHFTEQPAHCHLNSLLAFPAAADVLAAFAGLQEDIQRSPLHVTV